MTDTRATLAGRLTQFDLPNAVVAFGVWLLSLIIYLSTTGVTLTFWDCGEFIAACHTLGIPHPPGTPLYVMIGRLFALLPFYSDPAARINFLASFCSSIAVLFGYLCSVRIMRYWFGESESGFGRFVMYAGAACGAFFLGFSFTNWGNSIEAEVYGMAMAIFFAILWLMLIYFKHAGTRFGECVLLLIVYLSFLSIGVHMTTFLIFPIAAMFLILKKETPVQYWFIAAAVFVFELYLIFALSSRPNEIPYYVPVVAVFVLYLLYVFSVEKPEGSSMVFIGGFLVSIAPLFEVISKVLKRDHSASPTTVQWTPLMIVGLIGFGALVAWSLVQLVRGKSGRDNRPLAERPVAVSSLFVLVAAVMVILTVANVRGYEIFLVLSAFLLLGLGFALRQYIRPAIFLAVTGGALIILGVYQFLFGAAIVAVLLLVLGTMGLIREWRTGILILVLAVGGFSVHAFLPIRSSQNPDLDQTKTSESIKTTIAFIERKQYGNEPMVTRMFHRRAEWGNQFGMYQRMGFWRFFDAQYGINGARFFILFVLGILGVWEAVRRKSQIGLGFGLLLLICTVGLVLYMNFADGTRMNQMGGDYLEVRDRDYFWTPGFMLFGLAIGIGISALLLTIQDSLRNFSAGPRQLILWSSSVLFLLPVFSVSANYHENDRSNNYIAYDYAANLLRSTDKNAVLFTYGDNDTFPLWALQEAFHFRTDVAVVNLSLANISWYIKQVQSKMGVDLGWSDDQIDELRPYRISDGRGFTLDDQVVDAIVAHNWKKRPINYSTTVPESERRYQGRAAAPNLILKGLVYQLTVDSGSPRIDLDGSYRFFTDDTLFMTRGLNDPSLYKDDNMLRLTSAYNTAFLILADTLRKAKQFEQAENLIERGIRVLTPDKQLINYLATIYADQHKIDDIERMIGTNEMGDPDWLNLMLARGWREKGDTARAEEAYLSALRTNPHFRLALEDLSRMYNLKSEYGKMRRLFGDWLASNPDDKDIARIVRDLDSFMVKDKAGTDTKKK